MDIWRTGEYANLEVEDHFDYQDELSGKGQGMKRSNSITNVLPPLLTKEEKDVPIKTDKNKRESLITPKKSEKEVTLQVATSSANSKLTKAEKKQIKRDLLEFAKQLQGGPNKESQLRQNLILIEEGLEAKICEGSTASSILNDHKKNVTKNKTGKAYTKFEDSADRVSEIRACRLPDFSCKPESEEVSALSLQS